jgi:DNA repair protein RAD5
VAAAIQSILLNAIAPLFHIERLDEAQQIRNTKSKIFKAVYNVATNSEYRLALTGTPFVNKPEDICSLLTFIGLRPLADAGTFKTYITIPIKGRKSSITIVQTPHRLLVVCTLDTSLTAF